MTSTRRQQAMRRHVLERDGYRCCWCGGPATDADHLVPTSLGGADTMANMAAACARCNRGRGNRPRPPVSMMITAPPSRAW